VSVHLSNSGGIFLALVRSLASAELMTPWREEPESRSLNESGAVRGIAFGAKIRFFELMRFSFLFV
jgi:hypothetical protein